MPLEQFKGKRIKVTKGSLQGQEFDIEDSWINVMGKSWKWCDRNPACLKYAIRSSAMVDSLPCDNNVVYGAGTLLHESEIEII